MSEAKYQHLIPQTYLSAWANSKGTLQVEFVKTPGVIVSRNKDNIAGINDFYSIMAGMPIATEQELEEIFSPCSQYHIKLDGKILSTAVEMSKHYSDFDRWEITRDDSTPVRKKKIKDDIRKIKIRSLERKWFKYENGWNDEVKKIQENILSTERPTYIESFDKEYLMKFFTMLDWRGYTSNSVFDNVTKFVFDNYEDSVIPENERLHYKLPTSKEEARHDLLLKIFRDFLDDRGPMYSQATNKVKINSVTFFVSDASSLFISSDNPAFEYDKSKTIKEEVLPITPHILMVMTQNKNYADKFRILNCPHDMVEFYNTIIAKNAKEYVILSNI